MLRETLGNGQFDGFDISMLPSPSPGPLSATAAAMLGAEVIAQERTQRARQVTTTDPSDQPMRCAPGSSGASHQRKQGKVVAEMHSSSW